MKVTLEDSRFTESIKINPQGSIFLGYLYVVLTVSGDDDEEDLKIGMPDLQVRITRDQKPRVDFPADLKDINGVERWVPRYFSASKATRDAITALVFSLPHVSRAVDSAFRAQEQSKTA